MEKLSGAGLRASVAARWGGSVADLLSVCVLCAQSHSCSTLCSPMDCSPPGSSDHGIFQATILESVSTMLQGIFLTQGSPALAGGFFITPPFFI